MRSIRPPAPFLYRLAVLLLLTAAVGLVYQHVEDFIPYWDYARVESLFHQLEEAFEPGAANGMAWLFRQVNNVEYNSIFALPLMAATDFVGVSRDRIVMAVLLVHIALYLVAFAFLLRKVFGYRSLSEIGILQLGSALLLPSIFISTMLGFETIAVLPVLTVALTLFLAAAWPLDSERSEWSRVALFFIAGALFASTFLIRRAYAYTVISFYSTATVVLVLEIALGRVRWWSREMWIRTAGMAVVGLGTVTVLLGFARDRVITVLATPYHEMYSPWKMAPASVGFQLLASVGAIVLVVSLAGYCMRLDAVPGPGRVMALLLGSTAVVGFLHWIVLVRLRMRLDKPMLYAPMIALGTAMLFTGRGQRKWANVARWTCFGLLLINLGVSLGAVPEIRSLRAYVFANPHPPLVRHDMEAFREMTQWLREETVGPNGYGEPILVLAASGDINDSLVKEAEPRFFGWDSHTLNLPPFNTVDRTSNYPVWLHKAEWVLVAKPFQFHTSAKERRLLRFGWDEFKRNRGVARNFERLDQTWVLGRSAWKPVTVEVWRRTRKDNVRELIDLIDRSKDFVLNHPVFPNLWVGERSPARFRSTRLKRAGEQYVLHLSVRAGDQTTTSGLFLEPLGTGDGIRVETSIGSSNSEGCELVAELLDERKLRSGRREVLKRQSIPLVNGESVRIEGPQNPETSVFLRLALIRHVPSSTPGSQFRVRVNVEITPGNRLHEGDPPPLR